MHILPIVVIALDFLALQIDSPDSSAITDRINVASFHDARSIDEALFTKANAESLSQYRKHDHLGIALRAALEDVLRSATADVDVGAMNAAPTYRPTKESLVRFLSFAERRLEIQIPTWWKSGLLSSRRIGKNLLVTPVPQTDTFYERSSVGGLWLPKDTRITDSQVGFKLQSKNGGVLVPRSFVTSANADNVSGIVASFSGDKCIVALLSTGGRPFRICGFDPSTSECLWTASVWATGPVLEYEGRMSRPSQAELRIQDDRLYVFGIDIDGVYVEAFAIHDGRNLFRFSTSY